MKPYLPQQQFSAGKPINFRKPVYCRADEVDLLMEAARADGYGMTQIKTVKHQFIVTFQTVAAYSPTQPDKAIQ
jgi:hypothetical protein